MFDAGLTRLCGWRRKRGGFLGDEEARESRRRTGGRLDLLGAPGRLGCGREGSTRPGKLFVELAARLDAGQWGGPMRGVEGRLACERGSRGGG